MGTMETQRASLSLGRWSLWLLLLGLVLPSASAQALSYRDAVLRAVDQLNEQSSESNIYHLLELDQPPHDLSQGGGQGMDPLGGGAGTYSREGSLSPSPQCDFKEDGSLKQCEGTITLDQVMGNFNITCNNVSGPFCTVGTAVGVGGGTSFGPMTRCSNQGRERPSYPILDLKNKFL
uniref:Cathelicidin antimicrobial peptide n=1 Tax=Moschus moschiferus TaxID=68415 RepID=A0A8C6FUP0_MOSMO